MNKIKLLRGRYLLLSEEEKIKVINQQGRYLNFFIAIICNVIPLKDFIKYRGLK